MADKYTQAQRDAFAKSGVAMPDGSYPIADSDDLTNAILTVGLGNASNVKIRQHIIKRARALKLISKIPDTWASDGTVKHDASSAIERVLKHHGIKGQKWGVRRSRSELESDSEDHKTAVATRAKLKAGGGTRALSNEELSRLVDRMNLEQRYADLNSKASAKRKSAGQKLAEDLIGNPAKNITRSQIQRVGNDLATQQIDKALRNAGLKAAAPKATKKSKQKQAFGFTR